MVATYLFFCLLLATANAQSAPAPSPSPARSSWATLSGNSPLVIGTGNGAVPTQTIGSYLEALNKTAGGNALFCDVQLTKDGRGICRTNIDLGVSTSILQTFPNGSTSYVVNGQPTTGVFANDFTLAQLLSIPVIQSIPSRPATFDGQFPIFTPENLTSLLQSYSSVTGLQGFMWLNVEYAKFYEDLKINATGYVLSAIRGLNPAYVSSPEVGLLRSLRTTAAKIGTLTILKIPNITAVEPTTNQTYAALLANMTNIRRFVSGILVPKELIWPVDPTTNLLQPVTSLVKDAHAAKLEVHAYDFATDIFTASYNYSFDPIKEQLNFIKGPGFSVDGILTDFPTTASVAIECYASGTTAKETSGKVLEPFKGKQVITHSGGDSGNFPGSTKLSFQSAIAKGADYIDCPVQMTKDGVAICRQSPDLLVSTDVAQSQFLSEQRQVPFIKNPGIFTFDLTWQQIESLKAKIFSPQQDAGIERNQEYDGTQDILRLSDFLNITKANPGVGIYLVLQNAYILNGTMGLDAAAAVVSALKKEGLDTKSDVVIQSEDAEVLRALQDQVSATLIYSLSLPNESATLTDSVLKDIKQFASGVSAPRSFVSPATDEGYLDYPSDVVGMFHAHNLSVLVVFFRNEFTTLPFDFLADPTLELHTFVEYYGIDGVVTDFPGTAKSYLTNPCRKPSSRSFTIPTIQPGLLLTSQGVALPPKAAPAPPLGLAEPPLPPSMASPAPAPGNRRSSSVTIGASAMQILLMAAVALAGHRLW